MSKARVDKRNRVQRWTDDLGEAMGAPREYVDAPWPEGIVGFLVTCFAFMTTLAGVVLAWALMLGLIALTAVGCYVVFN